MRRERKREGEGERGRRGGKKGEGRGERGKREGRERGEGERGEKGRRGEGRGREGRGERGEGRVTVQWLTSLDIVAVVEDLRELSAGHEVFRVLPS